MPCQSTVAPAHLEIVEFKNIHVERSQLTNVFQILPFLNSYTKSIYTLLVLWVLIITVNNAVFSVTWPPGVNYEDCLPFLINYCVTVVVQMESENR